MEAEIREIEAARADLDLDERQAAAEREASEGRETLVALQRDLTAQKRAVQRLEAELAAHEADLAEREERLYSGTVTNPRELQQLEGQLVLLRRAQERLTEEILTAWEAVDSAEQHLTALEERIKAAVAAATARASEASGQDSRLTERLANARTRRAAILPQIDARLLGQYEKLAKTRGGRALARVENRVCQGCRVELPTSAHAPLAADAPGLCPHCGRILFWPARRAVNSK